MKNRGPKLTDVLQGQYEVLPPWVRATLTLIRTKQKGVEPTEAPPELSAGIVESSALQEVTDERQEVVVYLDPAQLPKTRSGKVVLPTGQVADVTETASNESLTIVSDPTLVDGEVEVIGGVNLKREVVAPVFPNIRFEVEKPDLVPQKFQGAVPRETTASTSAGTAAMPSLSAGQLAASSEQTREGWVRASLTSRSLTSFPVTLSGETIADWQLKATVTETLDDSPLTLTLNQFSQHGSRVENLGDGLYHRIDVKTAEIATNKIFGVSIDEAIPLAFRASVPLVTTREDLVGTAATPTLTADDVEKIEEQYTKFIKRVTLRTRNLGVAPTLFLKSWDNDLQTEITTELHLVAHNSAYSPGANVVDYDEREVSDEWSLRTIQTMPGGVSGGFTSYKPGEFTYPTLLEEIVVAAVALADQGGLSRSEVNWQPVWRPGFTIPVQYKIVTTLHPHGSPPDPDTIWLIRTNDVVFKGVSFQVNLTNVINDAIGPFGVAFVDDGLYGDLEESFSVGVSVPTRSQYEAAIGEYKTVASQVSPFRRIWIKQSTQLLIV